MERIERTALKNLLHNEAYARKVLPFIKEEYFSDKLEGVLFSEIYKFINKYNNLPTKEALIIELSNLKSITEEEFKQSKQILNNVHRSALIGSAVGNQFDGLPTELSKKTGRLCPKLCPGQNYIF